MKEKNVGMISSNQFTIKLKMYPGRNQKVPSSPSDTIPYHPMQFSFIS